MDILLLNNKEEVVSLYTQNDDYKDGNRLTLKDQNKKYKVVDIEKYRKLGYEEQTTLQLEVIGK